MVEIRWNYRVKNEDVLHVVKAERNVLRTRKQTKANCIGYILHSKCLLKQVIETNIEWKRWEVEDLSG